VEKLDMIFLGETHAEDASRQFNDDDEFYAALVSVAALNVSIDHSAVTHGAHPHEATAVIVSISVRVKVVIVPVRVTKTVAAKMPTMVETTDMATRAVATPAKVGATAAEVPAATAAHMSAEAAAVATAAVATAAVATAAVATTTTTAPARCRRRNRNQRYGCGRNKSQDHFTHVRLLLASRVPTTDTTTEVPLGRSR
jgi:hypothetical protein